MTLVHRARSTLAALSLACAAVTAVAEPEATWPTAAWPTADPEALGMDSRALARLVDFGTGTQMESLLVIRHGRIVCEAYYAPFTAGRRARLNTATQGVVGAAVGAAILAGKLRDAGQPALPLLPEVAPEERDPRSARITLQHLLEGTSGIQWKEPDGAPLRRGEYERTLDWARILLARPLRADPGVRYEADGGNMRLLSAIVTRATGQRTDRFVADALFTPMGITGFDWTIDPDGIATGDWGLGLTPRDFAKLGYLYLHNGRWDGRQLLPEEWADRIRQARVRMEMPSPDVFFQRDGWWTVPRRDIYLLAGYRRQMLLLQPSTGIVAVTTGRAYWPWHRFFDLLAATVVSNGAIAADPMAAASLRDRERSVAGR